MEDITNNFQKFDAMANVLAKPNSHAMGVMKLIDSYYPAMAKKVFERNPVVEAMAMSGFCSMDILIYPVCGHCETLALYHHYAKNPDGTPARDEDGRPIGVCKCKKCGKETVNPVKFFDWCMMELKKRAPEDIAESLVLAVDIIAERAIQDAKRVYRIISAKEYVHV
jgi:hypothetical protein